MMNTCGQPLTFLAALEGLGFSLTAQTGGFIPKNTQIQTLKSVGSTHSATTNTGQEILFLDLYLFRLILQITEEKLNYTLFK